MELRQPDPMSFEGNPAEGWKTFISAYTFYANALDLQKREQKVQCAIFLHIIGKDAQEVFKSFHIPGDPNFKALVTKFEEVFQCLYVIKFLKLQLVRIFIQY